MRRLVLPGALLGASLMISSCAVFADHGEYSAYRRTRLASEERDQLLTMQQYVEQYPEGHWATEIQAARAEREDGLWVRSSSTREGLEWYLRVYPDGRYVDQARPRLAALQHVANTADEQAQAQRELEQHQRDEAAEQRRTWVTRAVQYWTRTMVGLNGYGRSLRRIARSNADFAQAFGREPTPVCVQNEYCIKHYGQLYHIPVPGATRIDRHLDVYLRITMESGRVERAEILMPDKGFSRWFEMENRQIVTDEDETQRFEAINWALERIQPIIEEVARGAQQIELIPDPIMALQVAQEGQNTDAAPDAPSETAPSETAPSETAPDATSEDEQPEGEEATDEETGEFDDLLSQASGSDGETPSGEPEQTPEPEAEGETLVLPIGLIAYRYRNLRITVLAAGADDYGNAYDGVVIERIRD